MANTDTNTQSETTAHTESTQSAHPAHTAADENRWVARFEELLKVKNVDDLKMELGKLAAEIQTEIQKFDINAHLSPEAKSRLKTLESQYAKVMKAVQKAQKQFDREFNKSLRVLKRTRQDAEKHFLNIKTRITKHRGTIVKASVDLKQKIKKTAKKATSRATGAAKKATGAAKKSARKTTTKTKATGTNN